MDKQPGGVVRLVVILLGVEALMMAGGLLALALTERKPGDVLLTALVGLAGNATGALGALLVSTRDSGQAPAPVQVMNKQDDPVPVDAHPEG